MTTTRRWSLRTKWTLAVLAVGVVPTAVLGAVMVDIQRRGLARAEKELETAVVDEAAKVIERDIRQAAEVADRVEEIADDEHLDVDTRVSRMGDVVAHAPAIAAVIFCDANGGFVDAVVPRGTTLDDAARRCPHEKGFHDLRYTVMHMERGGSVSALLSRPWLDRQLADLSQDRFGADGRIVLVDEARAVVAGPHDAKPSDVATPPFSAWIALTTEKNGNVVTVRTLPEERWAMIVERPTDEAFAALTTARRAFAIATAVVAALAMLVALGFVRRVTGPIGSLMKLVTRYARRDFEAKSEVASGDELEALGASLETMASDLSQSEREIDRRARLEENLRRYLPKEAADAAAGQLALGGARKRAAIVFADVVAFTGFAERASPERVVAFLNELFSILSEIVFRHGGMVDKFIGDCVMAVFESPEKALFAAEDMHAFVESNAPRWRDEYAFGVELGIGVSAGEVLMGNLGSRDRMEYTVIGDAVNVAARLEMLARPRQTLTTREVADACASLSFVSLGEREIRGKKAPIEVLEVAP